MNNMDYAKPTNQNLEYLHRICFGLPITHIDIPPLKCGKRDVPSKIGIARTTRYTSAHLFLAMREEIFKHAMFLGTPFEYEVFKNAFNYEPIYMEINNALDAAEIINSTDIFFANGTLMYWIAVGLGHKHVINELGVDIPTTYFRDNPNISYVQGGRVVK